jgi:hypothetical protein
MPLVNVRVTEYQVSCLPLDGSARRWGGVFDVHVQWSAIGDLWAVRANGRVYDADGVPFIQYGGRGIYPSAFTLVIDWSRTV